MRKINPGWYAIAIALVCFYLVDALPIGPDGTGISGAIAGIVGIVFLLIGSYFFQKDPHGKMGKQVVNAVGMLLLLLVIGFAIMLRFIG